MHAPHPGRAVMVFAILPVSNLPSERFHMGIAHAVSAPPFTALLAPAFRRRRAAPATTGRPGTWQSHALARGRQHAASAAAPAHHTEPPAPRPSHARAVRVVHVADPGSEGANGHRLLISGRMADVCAELDRLARQEAQRLARP